MFAMNDGVNMVFIDINSNWGTVSQRSVVTEGEVFLRMFYNVCLKNMRAARQASLSMAAERG